MGALPNFEFEENILNWLPQANSGKKPDWPKGLLKMSGKNPRSHAPLIHIYLVHSLHDQH